MTTSKALNMNDLLRRNKIDRDLIYDYELISFLKKEFNLNYQNASMFIKAIKGTLT
jgi:hypothetical protein